MERSILSNASTFATVPKVYIYMPATFSFKRIFGGEVLLRGFLNALFEKERKLIESLEYIGTDGEMMKKKCRLLAKEDFYQKGKDYGTA